MTPNLTQLANLQEQLTQLQRTIAELQRTPRQPRRILKLRSVARETTQPRSNGYRLFDQEFETRNAAETLVQLLNRAQCGMRCFWMGSASADFRTAGAGAV